MGTFRVTPVIYNDMLRKPFAEGGRGPGSYDCAGAVIEFLTRAGRHLPPGSFPTDYATADAACKLGDGLSYTTDIAAMPWAALWDSIPNRSVEPHDIAFYLDGTSVAHVAVVVQIQARMPFEPYVLTASRERGVCVVSAGRLRGLRGFYRLRSAP